MQANAHAHEHGERAFSAPGWPVELLISPQGPEGLFPAAKLHRMVQVINGLKCRAAA